MANVEKFKLKGGRLEAVLKHCHRSFSNPGNPEIDLSLSSNNVDFIIRDKLPYEYFKERLDQIWHINRDDIVGMYGVIVTVPKDVAPEYYNDFFHKTHDFLINRYCHGSDDNCIMSVVHMDETTPHLHF